MAGLNLAGVAWRNLWRNKRRTLITLGAIAFGCFLAVMFTAMQDRSFADMIDLSARLGGGHVVVQHPDYLDAPALSRTVSHTDRVRAQATSDPLVHRAVDRIQGQAMLSTASNNVGVFFVAYDPAAEDDTTLSFLDGRIEGELLTPDSADHAIVLGEHLARNLDAKLGSKVVYTLMDRHGELVAGLGRVSGILQTGAPSMDRALVMLPIDQVREVLSYEPHEATQVAVFINDSRRSDRVAGTLSAALPADGPAALPWHVVQPELFGFIAMKVGGARFMELVIMILVAASIFNTLFVSVMERMREFGIMRAIGYTPGQIFGLVMWESMWLALVGLITAAAITSLPYYYLATHGIDISGQLGEEGIEVAGVGMSTVLNVGIFPENVALIAAFAVAATLLSGLYPAYKAGRVTPVDTIRLV